LAVDLAQKLRLTAAALGCNALKDLAREFRRTNPSTPFDVEPAYKWLQGRSAPRSAQVYADWSALLDLGQTPEWVQRCTVDAFADAVCRRHGLERQSLLLRAARFGRAAAGGTENGDSYLAGVYACYSMAWSPYYAGRLIRGCMSLAPGSRRLVAEYSENLPTGPFRAHGNVVVGRRSIHMAISQQAGEEPLQFSLMLPGRPASLILGILSGITLLAPEPLPSTSRIALVRVPAGNDEVNTSNRYLEADCSLARDLAALGLGLPDPATVDRLLGAFLSGGGQGGWDQVPSALASELMTTFDRYWFERTAEPAS
jgi:hypothetical protein